LLLPKRSDTERKTGKKTGFRWERPMRFRTLAIWGAGTGFLCLAGTVSAQAQVVATSETSTQASPVPPAKSADSDTATQPTPAAVADIVVTGTRLANFAAPTPVTALAQQEIETKGARTVTDLMLDIPALKFNQNNGTVSQPIGASNLDLRGLGPSRTLLLLDGRRFAATDPTGGVDVSVIPAVLISKIEIVTGGASAAYGSDAVSGVVNVTLDSRLNGIKGSVQYGQTTYNDLRQPGASLAVGKSALDDRFHIVIAGDYYHNSGQLDQSERPWGRRNYAVLTNPAYTGTNGVPQRLILPGTTTSQLTYGGVTAINSIPALRGIQFGQGGAVLPFRYGTNLGNTFMTGGDGATPMESANIAPRYTRYSGFGKASFEMTPGTTLYADVLFSRSKAYADQLANLDQGNLVIRRDNAFLPATVRALIPANGTLSIGRLNGEDGVFDTQTIATVRRYGLGVDGHLGGSWEWGAFAQLSRNSYARDDRHNRITDRWLKAVDSIISPVTGQAVCRVNADASPANDDPRCVPANVFGAGSISPQAVAYYSGTSTLRASQHQDVYAANLNGSPFSTGAGEVRIATGAEYRREAVNQTSDPISQANGWRQINAQTLKGSFNVKEVYAEVGVPLVKGVPLISNLDVNAAVRFTKYSTSGSVTTWKAGGNYTPLDGIRFRATISRDIRAPNVNELFSGQSQVIPIILDPLTNRSFATPVLTGGNPDLQPERAKTYTGGFILEPSFLRGFHLSMDYYSIAIDDAILGLTGQQVVDGCYVNLQDTLCSAITRDAGSSITRVRATLFNAANYKTNGLDIEAAYSLPLGEGRLTARLLANYVGKLYSSTNGDTAGTTGQTNSIPHWRGNLGLYYRTGLFAVGALARYVQGGLYNNLYVEGGGINSVNDNHLRSRTYLDLNGSYSLRKGLEIFFKINNAFDRDPPISPAVVTQAGAANSPFYDRFGRYISAGARFQF
jgi:iron complex outermembrane receptor protein